MLQQTQVSRVLLYFQKWLSLFPTIQSLSESSEEAVIKAWEGLGYYSRARALLKGAQYICENFNGVLPSEKAKLLSIPGIGEYTQGAIRSFAFHERAAAVDANVIRVISRVYDLPIEQGSISAYESVLSIVNSLLPEKESWITMEALIEFGALVCSKQPRCIDCPLQKKCLSFRNQTVQERPRPKKPLQRIHEKRAVFIFQRGDYICVVKRQGKGVMSGLWEFPYCPYSERVLDQFDSTLQFLVLEPIRHSYTKYSIVLYPYLFSMPDTFSWPEGEWVKKEELNFLAYSSGHKKITLQLTNLL
jgi:A/G-specific adenine glycosylase